MKKFKKNKEIKKTKIIPNDIKHIEFNFENIKNICKQYNYTVSKKTSIDNNLLIEINSKYDDWLVEHCDNRLILKHRLRLKKTMHVQNVFWDYEFLIKSIRNHDSYREVKYSKNKYMKNLDLIRTGDYRTNPAYKFKIH